MIHSKYVYAYCHSSLNGSFDTKLSEDIGGMVAFLCTDAARWVNAQRLEASGGMFL